MPRAKHPGAGLFSETDQTTFEVQKRFVDYAAEMGWQYTLVDALWDVQIGYPKLEELVAYAKARGVKILVWYNSAGDWNFTPQTPRNLMLTHESRIREFERLKRARRRRAQDRFFRR